MWHMDTVIPFDLLEINTLVSYHRKCFFIFHGMTSALLQSELEYQTKILVQNTRLLVDYLTF